MNKIIYPLIARIDLHDTKHYIMYKNIGPKDILYARGYTDSMCARFWGIEKILGLNTPCQNIFLMNVTELKQSLKHVGLKTCGLKSDIQHRLLAYGILRKNAIIIQKIFRKWKIHRIHLLFTRYETNRNKCVNDTDFYNLDKLDEIPKYKFITVMDTSGIYYGFSVQSLYNLSTSESTVLNPYTRQPIPEECIKHVKLLYKTPHIARLNFSKQDDGVAGLSIEDKYKLRVVSIFQQINMLGHYSDSSWFLELSMYNMVRFIRFLKDIWQYRANLSVTIRREICPLGNPFNMNVPEIETLSDLPTDLYLKLSIIHVIEMMIYSGINTDSRTLGSYYVLSALTLVSIPAANAFPWLYQSLQEDNMY